MMIGFTFTKLLEVAPLFAEPVVYEGVCEKIPIGKNNINKNLDKFLIIASQAGGKAHY